MMDSTRRNESRPEGQQVPHLAPIRETILEEIGNRRDEFIDLCSKVVHYPSENPPGNTVEAIDGRRKLLLWPDESAIETKAGLRTSPNFGKHW